MLEVMDPFSSTPGRQDTTWRDLVIMNSMLVEADASSTAVEIDIGNGDSYEARRAAWHASEADRFWSHSIHTPYSYEARQFTWTWRCPTDGCGWQEASDMRISYCRRCYFGLMITQPRKHPTFLGTACQWWFDNQEEVWFYFCHTCQECTWNRRCCDNDCVDVHALKQVQRRGA